MSGKKKRLRLPRDPRNHPDFHIIALCVILCCVSISAAGVIWLFQHA